MFLEETLDFWVSSILLLRLWTNIELLGFQPQIYCGSGKNHREFYRQYGNNPRMHWFHGWKEVDNGDKNDFESWRTGRSRERID